MEDRLLKFVSLVHIGNYTKAAQANNISQPALTMAVQQLEKEIGEKLLIRTRGKLELTAAGAAAYQAGLAIKGALRTLQVSLENSHTNTVTYRVGAIDSIASSLFSKQSFFDKLQNIGDVQLIVDTTSRLLHLLDIGEIDVAIAAETSHIASTITSIHSVVSEQMNLICAPSQLAKYTQQIAQKEISDVIAYNANSNTFSLIETQLANFDITQKIRMHSTSPDTMLKMAEQGLGAAFLPLSTIKHAVSHNLVAIVPSINIIRPISIYSSEFIHAPYLLSLIETELRTIS